MSPGIVPSNLQHTTAPLYCFSQARPRRTTPAMKHGSAYPGDHHARSNPKIIHKTLFIQKLINPLPYCTKPPRHSFSKLYAPHSPSTPRPPLRSTTPERMVVVSTAAPSLRHRPHPTLVLHDTLRVPSGTTFRYKPFQGPGFLSGVIPCCIVPCVSGVEDGCQASTTATRPLRDFFHGDGMVRFMHGL